MFEKKIQETVDNVKENVKESAKPQVKKYLIGAGVIGVGLIFAWKAGYREGLKTGLLINK